MAYSLLLITRDLKSLGPKTPVPVRFRLGRQQSLVRWISDCVDMVFPLRRNRKAAWRVAFLGCCQENDSSKVFKRPYFWAHHPRSSSENVLQKSFGKSGNNAIVRPAHRKILVLESGQGHEPGSPNNNGRQPDCRTANAAFQRLASNRLLCRFSG